MTSLPDNNPKTVFGVTKPPMGLIPTPALLHLAMAMKNGAEKYGPYNWREKNVSSMIYVDAAERHLRAWLDGEERAKDSGVHHLGHVMACCAILLDAQTVGNLNDNRPAPAPTAELIEALTAKPAELSPCSGDCNCKEPATALDALMDQCALCGKEGGKHAAWCGGEG